MRDAIALTADLFTIVGVVTLIAFLMNHPVTKRLGVWAGALSGADGYGWRRRNRGIRHWRRNASKPLLSLLSRLGGETRQPMTPPQGQQPLPIDAPYIAALLAPYARADEDLRRRHQEQADREQRSMLEAATRIAMRRWRREHKRLRCDGCERGFRDALLTCLDDCSWSEQRPKRLRHICGDCAAALVVSEASASEPEPGER